MGQDELPRLVDVDAFPEEHRAAVRAAASAMAAEGYNTAKYTAAVYPDGRMLEVYVRHDRHPPADPDRPERGDVCGRCRVIRYSPRTGKVLRIFGIR